MSFSTVDRLFYLYFGRLEMTTIASQQSGRTATPTAPHRAMLPILLIGIFMAVLDFFIVNVAIPSIGRDLSAGPTSIEWVVAAYGLAYGVGLITGGRLGDSFGRRRMFLLGVALFTLASAACGLAPTATFLIGARAVQGLAAALMIPQILAIVGATFSGPERARAINIYGTVLGLAAVFGQLIGGLLIHADLLGLGWRACFLINIPIGAAAIVLAARFVPEPGPSGRPRIDVVGMVIATFALVALVLPLIEGRQHGWPLWTWLSLGSSAVLFVVFGRHQMGRGDRATLIDVTLFKERAFTAGLTAQLAYFMGNAAFFLVFTLYVQQGHGLSALNAGLVFVPMGVGYMATSLTARHLAARMGRQVIALGALVMLVGQIGLIVTATHIGVHGSVGWLVPAIVLVGAGMGLTIAPLATTILSRIDPRHAGAASGVLSTVQQIGNALGVALIGVVFYDAHGFQGAFEHSLIYLMAVAVVVVALVQLLPRQRSAVNR
jgi:EmrB/QacA subfamily drug resistance transporter